MATVDLTEMIDTAREFAGSMAEELDRIQSNATGSTFDAAQLAALRALHQELRLSQSAVALMLDAAETAQG